VKSDGLSAGGNNLTEENPERCAATLPLPYTSPIHERRREMYIAGVQKTYGAWPSPISAEAVATQGLRMGGVAVDGEDVYWLEGRPKDGGRNVLMRVRPDGRRSEVTPSGFNVRTRVQEYGGGAFVLANRTAYFSMRPHRKSSWEWMKASVSIFLAAETVSALKE